MLIQSEIGNLKKVLIHRPCQALKRLTPSNCDHFLFDDVLWPEKAEEEHLAFSQLLREQGVEVLFLAETLKEALCFSGARDSLIAQYLSEAYHGSRVEELLTQYLLCLSTEKFIEQLFSGITFKDLAPYSLGLVSKTSLPEDFVIAPLPNQLFMRDSSAWVGQGVAIGRMAFKVRQPETAIMSTIYCYHPHFQAPIWYLGSDVNQNLPSIEGGDILVLNDHCLLIGIGQRTQAQALEILAKHLFQMNKITEIIAVDIPKKRASMHLDTILTMVDHDAFCSFHPNLHLPCWSIKPGEHENDLNITLETNLSKTLARVLKLPKIRIIAPEGDAFALEREQWNDAVNVLAVKPGHVLAYEQNILTNRKLRNAGIKVMTFSASELSRGRGGSRCMTCPLEREPLC